MGDVVMYVLIGIFTALAPMTTFVDKVIPHPLLSSLIWLSTSGGSLLKAEQK